MFAKRYFGKGVVFHVPQSLAQKWFGVVHAVVKWTCGLHCEIRLTEKLFETNNLSVRRLCFALYHEMDESLDETSWTSLDNVSKCMKFQVVFGQPAKTAWIGVPDLREKGREYPLSNDTSSTAFCERNLEASSRGEVKDKSENSGCNEF